jgi:uncharacterized membrane protein (DUF2068 family)
MFHVLSLYSQLWLYSAYSIDQHLSLLHRRNCYSAYTILLGYRFCERKRACMKLIYNALFKSLCLRHKSLFLIRACFAIYTTTAIVAATGSWLFFFNSWTSSFWSLDSALGSLSLCLSLRSIFSLFFYFCVFFFLKFNYNFFFYLYVVYTSCSCWFITRTNILTVIIQASSEF